MVVTVSELARGFGHLSQGRSAVREQYATKAEVWRPTSGNGSGRNRSKLSSGTGPVNWRLTLFRRPDAAPYSSEVQQPVRATAIMSLRPHTRNAVPLDREHGRADSLHPDGGHTGQTPG